MYYQFLIPCISFFFNTIACLLLLRYRRSLTIVWSLIYAAVIGMIALGVLQALATQFLDFSQRDHFGFFLANAGIYFTASYCFFHVVHIPLASVRLRILRELEDGASLSREDILQRYGAKAILEIRLARLLQSDQIRESEGRYVSGKPKMLYIARIFRVLKKIALGV